MAGEFRLGIDRVANSRNGASCSVAGSACALLMQINGGDDLILPREGACWSIAQAFARWAASSSPLPFQVSYRCCRCLRFTYCCEEEPFDCPIYGKS